MITILAYIYNTLNIVTASASDEDDSPGSTFVRINLSKIATSTENMTVLIWHCLALEPDTEKAILLKPATFIYICMLAA